MPEIAKAHLLDGSDAAAQLFRQSQLARRAGRIGRSTQRLLRNGISQRRMGVSMHHRRVVAQTVEVDVAIHVGQVLGLPLLDVEGVRVEVGDGAGIAAGQVTFGREVVFGGLRRALTVRLFDLTGNRVVWPGHRGLLEQKKKRLYCGTDQARWQRTH